MHCHAGQGRTAIIIGAYLLYANLTETADEAIRTCIAHRNKLFSNAYNKAYLQQFAQFLKQLRIVYPLKDKSLNIKDLLK